MKIEMEEIKKHTTEHKWYYMVGMLISFYIILMILMMVGLLSPSKSDLYDMCEDYGTVNNVETVYLLGYDRCLFENTKILIHRDSWIK